MVAEGIVVAATAFTGRVADPLDPGCRRLDHAFHPSEFLARLLVCYCHIIANCLGCDGFATGAETGFVDFCPGYGRLCPSLYRRLGFHLYLCCYIVFPCDLRPSSRLGNSDSIMLIDFLVLGSMSCFVS